MLKQAYQKIRDCEPCAKRQEKIKKNARKVKDAWNRFKGSP